MVRDGKWLLIENEEYRKVYVRRWSPCLYCHREFKDMWMWEMRWGWGHLSKLCFGCGPNRHTEEEAHYAADLRAAKSDLGGQSESRPTFGAISVHS